ASEMRAGWDIDGQFLFYMLALIKQHHGDYNGAEATLKSGVEMNRQAVARGSVETYRELAACLTGLARIRLLRGQTESAAKMLGAAATIREHTPPLTVMEGVVGGS